MNTDEIPAGGPEDLSATEPDQATDIDVSGADATPLCPQCLSEIDQRASFCPQCQAPVGAFATYDPLQQIQSTGWLYRKALRGKISPLATLAMWLIFGPFLFGAVLQLLISGRESGSFIRVGTWCVGVTIALAYGSILYRVTRNYIRYRDVEIVSGRDDV